MNTAQSASNFTNASGSKGYVRIVGGAVELDQKLFFNPNPEDDWEPAKPKLVLMAERAIGGAARGRNTTFVREFGFAYSDGGRSQLVAQKGCVLSESRRRLDRGNVEKKGLGFNVHYGVSTITVGIPILRYKWIASQLKQNYNYSLKIENEVHDDEYVWVEASIQDVSRTGPAINPRTEAYELSKQDQVIVLDPEAYDDAGNLGAILNMGSFYHVLEELGGSIAGIAFGTMRVKYGKDSKGSKVKPPKLGFTIQCLQFTDISIACAPDINPRRSKNLYDPSVSPSPDILEDIRPIIEGARRLAEGAGAGAHDEAGDGDQDGAGAQAEAEDEDQAGDEDEDQTEG